MARPRWKAGPIFTSGLWRLPLLLTALLWPAVAHTLESSTLSQLRGHRWKSDRSFGDDTDFDVSASGAPQGVDFKAAALKWAGGQLEVAREAEAESEVNAKALVADQQRLVAEMAAEEAEAAALLDSTAIPDAKAALAETRALAIAAQTHADHVQAVLQAFKQLPKEAAKVAVETVRRDIRQASYAAAAGTNAALTGGLAARRVEKVKSRVAEGMQPYHLALLRAQKDLAESEAKAESAAKAAGRLATTAKNLARGAQSLQVLGMGAQARQTMALAHATAEQGANMRQWALRLRARAEYLQGTLGGLQADEAQAAAYAAAHVGEEVVPPFPGPPANVVEPPTPTAPPC